MRIKRITLRVVSSRKAEALLLGRQSGAEIAATLIARDGGRELGGLPLRSQVQGAGAPTPILARDIAASVGRATVKTKGS